MLNKNRKLMISDTCFKIIIHSMQMFETSKLKIPIFHIMF